MSIDHSFDDLYDLDDLRASEAWFDAAAAGLFDGDDPIAATVSALLGRLDREVALLAPVTSSTEAAIVAALHERAKHVAPPRSRVVTGRRQVRRSVLVLGVTATLVAGAAGVAAASPGSWLFPVRQVMTGQSGSSTPEDLTTAAHILDLVEVDIAAAQNAGGINDVTRRDLAARLGVIHDVIEAGGGAEAEALLVRWTRDDLVLIAMPRIADAPAPTTDAPGTNASPTPSPSLSDGPSPVATPSPTPSPALSVTPSEPASHGAGHTTPVVRAVAPKPHRSAGKPHSTPAPVVPRHSPSTGPAPSPTPTSGGGDHQGSGPTASPSPSSSQHPSSHPSPTPTGKSGNGRDD